MAKEFHPPYLGPRHAPAEPEYVETSVFSQTAGPLGTNVPPRLISMDAYRGFVMICLAANGFGLAKAAGNFPESSLWQAIGQQFEHVEWVGCAFWDLIQPSFMFLVGVALPYSYARREAAGESAGTLWKHVLFRSLVLILLGLFLSSIGKPTTNFTFMNVLTQIGLGYPVLFLLRNRHFAIQFLIGAAILGAYWAWFAFTPAVPIENLKEHHLPENWKLLEGFDAHWQKNVNPAAEVDRWLLNLFPALPGPAAETQPEPAAAAPSFVKPTTAEPVATDPAIVEPAAADPIAAEPATTEPATSDASTVDPTSADSTDAQPAAAEPTIAEPKVAEPVIAKPIDPELPGFFERCISYLRRLVTRPEPYIFNGGGYQTLNFVPSLVTMLIGLMAGEFIRAANYTRVRTFGMLLVAGLFLLAIGWGWQTLGGCPLVKRIWTPSWTLFSTGWTLIILAGFYGIIDCLGLKTWSSILVVAGMNSMVLYLMGQLLRGWTADILKRHVNENLFQICGMAYAPIVEANLVLLCFWLFVYWLYRQRIFVRI